MFFQGILYRGYFKSFTVTESVQKLGWFDYNIDFVAYARQGSRHNFMPWHKQPESPAGPSNPYSFTELNEPLELLSVDQTRNERRGGADTSLSKDIYNSNDTRSVAADFDGRNIKGLDLRR
jgi:hypothetical protein